MELNICLFVISIVILQITLINANNNEWPIPYKRYDSRPANNDFCQAKYPFCLGGFEKDSMPKFPIDDTIEIFALKAPVWEFKYGSLLKYFNIMHDAIGMRSVKTGINFTIEWYELDQLLNCTFPHLIENELVWCNQGATCVTKGIVDIHWSQNGTLVKVGEMSGKQYQQYSDYVQWDNRTGIFYETWTVRSSKDGRTWFEAHDCSTFVLNSLKTMANLGVKFNKTISLNYTIIEIISDIPIALGNITDIKKIPSLYQDILKFYSHFQTQSKIIKYFEEAIKIIIEVLLKRRVYLFYNYEYWYLPIKYPYLKKTYNEIPLP